MLVIPLQVKLTQITPFTIMCTMQKQQTQLIGILLVWRVIVGRLIVGRLIVGRLIVGRMNGYRMIYYTIFRQTDDLMETITLSSPLWKGTNGITIPLPVLQKPSTLGEILGAGSFGHVYLYKDLRNEKPVLVAIKLILTNQINMVKTQVEDVCKEVAVHAGLKHPNIIQYFGSYVGERHICIMMEHADSGNLREHINSNNGKVIGWRLLRFTQHILLGLHYLHTLPNPIIYRDLRSPKQRSPKQSWPTSEFPSNSQHYTVLLDLTQLLETHFGRHLR